MSFYVGDSSPKTAPFAIPSPTDEDGEVLIDGTEVASVLVKVERPDGTVATWTAGTLTTTESEVSFLVTLESDGSSLPAAGEYYSRVWLYDASDVLLWDTDETLLFTVLATVLTED
jgi:hypothetical protein